MTGDDDTDDRARERAANDGRPGTLAGSWFWGPRDAEGEGEEARGVSDGSSKGGGEGTRSMVRFGRTNDQTTESHGLAIRRSNATSRNRQERLPP